MAKQKIDVPAGADPAKQGPPDDGETAARPPACGRGRRSGSRPSSGGAPKRGAQRIVQRKTGELIPYARNAKDHPEKQVAQLAGSIKAFGFNQPVLIDEAGEIIAGHGRVLAAQKLKLAKVPCIVLAYLSET